MKKHLYLIALLALIMASCCKGPYPIAAVSVSYPNLFSTKQLKAYTTDRDNLNNITDTLFLGELNASNSFTTVIDFDENAPNYILFVEGTIYTDTLSEIDYSRKNNCKKTIENFQYKFNGDLRIDTKITIE